jgi:hypothetical protein
VTVKDFKKCCISSAVDGTNGMLWNDHEEDVGVRTECDKDEGTDCEEETVTLMGKGKQILTFFVY